MNGIKIFMNQSNRIVVRHPMKSKKTRSMQEYPRVSRSIRGKRTLTNVERHMRAFAPEYPGHMMWKHNVSVRRVSRAHPCTNHFSRCMLYVQYVNMLRDLALARRRVDDVILTNDPDAPFRCRRTPASELQNRLDWGRMASDVFQLDRIRETL